PKDIKCGLGGFHAICYNGGNLRNAMAPQEQLFKREECTSFNCKVLYYLKRDVTFALNAPL
ncbi:MAG: hypothetical protein AAF630_12850, partial [Cyanobacteria bacterium P01_C01_bin.38]